MCARGRALAPRHGGLDAISSVYLGGEIWLPNPKIFFNPEMICQKIAYRVT